MLPSAPDFERAAETLLGAPADAIDPVGNGGNSRVFRVTRGEQRFALKQYPIVRGDRRDRIGHEIDALRFFERRGIANVPRVVAVDRGAGFALFTWIDGQGITGRDATDIARAAAFLAQLDRARDGDDARRLPFAIDAVLAARDLDGQVAQRFTQFADVAASDAELASVLDEVHAVWTPLRVDDAAPTLRLTLSPSDFGFHNALRRPDGDLVFVDFEYFGWDDPAKLVCDACWHPGMEMTREEQTAFVRAMRAVYADDPAFVDRLRRDWPRYGVRWVLIVLREFLPDVWQRRSWGGRAGDWTAAKRRQAAKARELLERVRCAADIPGAW
jgi:hypothetical protein